MGEAGDDVLDVFDAVSTDVVDTDVEQVGAVAHLLLRNLDAVIQSALQHGLTEGFRAVGVVPLADGQVGGVLSEAYVLVEARDPVIALGCSGERPRRTDSVDDRFHVCGCGATASADEREPEFFDELLVRGRELLGTQGVGGSCRGEHGEARIGHHHHGNLGVLGELAQVLAHLLRSCRAVEADHVDTERLQCGECRVDFRAHQHGPGGLHRHFDKERKPDARFAHGVFAAVDCCFGLKEVL